MSPPQRPPSAEPVPPTALVVRPAYPLLVTIWITLVCTVPSANVRRSSYVPTARFFVCQLKIYCVPSLLRLVPGVGVGLNDVPSEPLLRTGATSSDVTALTLVITLPLA